MCLPRQKLELRSLGQKDLWRRKWQPTPVIMPGKSCGQVSLVGYSPQRNQTQLNDSTTATTNCPLTFAIIFSSRPKGKVIRAWMLVEIPKQKVISVLMPIEMPKSWTKPAKEWVWKIFCFLIHSWPLLNLISRLTFPWSQEDDLRLILY